MGLLLVFPEGIAIYRSGAAERRAGWFEPCMAVHDMAAGCWEVTLQTTKKHGKGKARRTELVSAPAAGLVSRAVPLPSFAENGRRSRKKMLEMVA